MNIRKQRIYKFSRLNEVFKIKQANGDMNYPYSIFSFFEKLKK